MEHPFDSVPLVWLIQEDILARRLPSYEFADWEDHVTMWKSSFRRAYVVVFPDFPLPMMYSSLDTGNFYVIPGSPVSVWEAEIYTASHSRSQLRKDNGFDDNDLVMLVIGSYFFYDELLWEYVAIMNALIPEMKKITKLEGLRGTFKLLFLCGDSTVAHDSAFQEDRSFPPLLLRAMSFEISIIVPKLDFITKYVVDQVHGVVFHQNDPDTLVKALSLLIEVKKLSRLAYAVASSGKLQSRNMLASKCISDYVKLLENLLQFPSDAMHPLPISRIEQNTCALDLLEKENTQSSISAGNKSPQNNWTIGRHNIVVFMEKQVAGKLQIQNTTHIDKDFSAESFPTQLDWDILAEMEILEDSDRLEREESKRAQRPRSDDIDGVGRLPMLNDAYYIDLLCEFAAMFSIANKVDSIHNMPWIGFQSWRAVARKVSLSIKAQKVLKQTAQRKSLGDIIYFWCQ